MARLNDDYRFDLDLAFGQVQEQFIKACFDGKEKIEVKTMNAEKCLAIEVYSRGKPSGLATTQADYWFIHFEVYGFGVYVPVERLKDLVRNFVKKYPFNCEWGKADSNNFLIIIPFNYFFNELTGGNYE